MSEKKIQEKKIETIKERAISLLNDCDDLRFTLFLEDKPNPEGWNNYHCALMIKNPRSGEYKNLYSSGEGEIVSELSTADLVDLIVFLKKSLELRNQKHEFTSDTKDFSINITGEEDIFKVTASIDLCTFTAEKLETGYGDSVISLSYGSTAEEISTFCNEVEKWLSQSL